MRKCFLLLFLISLFFFTYETKAQLSSIVAKNEKAVFVIETYNEYGACNSSGTGFFIDRSGIGLTALHVFEDAKFAYAKNFEGKVFRIEKIIGICEECDMATFQVVSDGSIFPYITTTTSLPSKGSDLFIIGNPEGYKNSVTNGILSGIKKEKENTVIQTTAAISSGSSGSPLMNKKGQAIGVVSYSNRNGQNLNFAYGVGCLDKMQATSSYQLSSPLSENIYFINKICPGEQNLTLHSIELSDTATIINFAYTNASIAFGDGAFIYTVVSDTTQSMYLRERETGRKFYCKGTTLGTSVKVPTYMKIGETVYFKLFFPPIGKARAVDISEGMKGGDWSFDNLVIPEKADITYTDLEIFHDTSFQYVMSLINDEYYKDAHKEINELQDKYPYAERLDLMGAVVSYVLGFKKDAIDHLNKIISLGGASSGSYADLYELYMELDMPAEALENINLAMRYNYEYIEYYRMRADAQYELENWREAIKDYESFIASGRELNSDIYFKMARSKYNINDPTACSDLEKAKDLADSDREWEKIDKIVRASCRK